MIAALRIKHNFTFSRNPNVPVALPEGTPTWLEFTTESDSFLEINNNNIQVITTPNKERLMKLGRLRDARKLQRHADQRPASAGNYLNFFYIIVTSVSIESYNKLILNLIESYVITVKLYIIYYKWYKNILYI